MGEQPDQDEDRVIELHEGQAWEMTTRDSTLVVALLRPEIKRDRSVRWRALVLHDTLYPDVVGRETFWNENEILNGFARIA